MPSLSGASGTQGGGGNRAAELRAAAQCVRQHGVPSFADPVLTPSGVYSDARSFQNASQAALNEVRAACGTLMTRAGLNPEGAARPAAAGAGRGAFRGVRPGAWTAKHEGSDRRTPYTPGHGFGFRRARCPAGGKLSHGFQEAGRACGRLFAVEIRASTLASLRNDG